MGKLDGKVVIVTGASRGIGAEIARAFAAEGGKVICAARTLQEGTHPLEGSLETTVTAIRTAGGEATPVAVNISLPEECEQLVQETRRIYGPPDVLVNNAALTYYIPIKGLDHSVGHLRICAADCEARVVDQPCPESPQTWNAVSAQKIALQPWCRQSG
jgi:NAD(P)-dependent dehydrogenase (short-subunit alcohol dehydrogenase family)